MKRSNANGTSDLDLKINKLIKELDQVKKEHNFQTREISKVMMSLSKSITVMLNPVLTSFIQVNTIFFSKSQAIFAPVQSIDPNAALVAKDMDTKVRRQTITQSQAFEQVAAEQYNNEYDSHMYQNAEADAQGYDQNQYNQPSSDPHNPQDSKPKAHEDDDNYSDDMQLSSRGKTGPFSRQSDLGEQKHTSELNMHKLSLQ